jgi:hypothetical protein
MEEGIIKAFCGKKTRKGEMKMLMAFVFVQ